MKSFERKLFPYLMLLPMIVIFGVFLFYPALNGLKISFMKWDGINPQEFVGLKNYSKLLGDKAFWRAFTRTIAFTAIGSSWNLCGSPCLALLLTREVKGSTFFPRSILLADHDFQYCSRFILEIFVRRRFWRYQLYDYNIRKVSCKVADRPENCHGCNCICYCLESGRLLHGHVCSWN